MPSVREDPLEMPVPRRVPLRAIGEWIPSSCRLVARKPHYWLPLGLLFFAIALALTFVPVAGNWLRTIVGDLYGAVLFALAWTQAAEGRIALRRALARVGRVVPTLLAMSVFVTVLEQAIELAVLRPIASDEEFALYAYATISNHPARPAIDFVHTVIGLAVPTMFGFAAPLAIVRRAPAITALRASVAAFALAPAAYLGFITIAMLSPHSLAYLGAAGGLAFIAIQLLVFPSGYFVFRSAFGDVPAAEAAEDQ